MIFIDLGTVNGWWLLGGLATCFALVWIADYYYYPVKRWWDRIRKDKGN